MNKATGASNASIPQDNYYLASFKNPNSTMSIIIKHKVDSPQWRFIDFSAAITFLVNPQTDSIAFTQQQHDKAMEIISMELQKFVQQRFPINKPNISQNDYCIENNITQKGNSHMENTPQVFKFDTNTIIRTLVKNEEPYFVVKDVCDALELKQVADAIRTLKENYEQIQVNIDGVILTHPIADALGRLQDTTIINETGLYDLIMQSRKPSALKFKHWITSEVLPSIRKHGFYGTDNFVENALNDPDTLITVLQNYKAEKEAKIAAQQQVKQLSGKIEEDKPKVLFADSVSASHSDILIGELAKLIKQNGYNIGQNRLFDWLRENGYLMKGGSSKNMPTQKSMDLELIIIKESSIVNADGSIRITKTPKVTGKGQVYFVNKFLGQQEAA